MQNQRSKQSKPHTVQMVSTRSRKLTRGFGIFIRVLTVRDTQMGIHLGANQLVPINGSTNFLMRSSMSCTRVWVWKGPSAFVTHMDSVTLIPCTPKKPPNCQNQTTTIRPQKQTEARSRVRKTATENQEPSKHLRRDKSRFRERRK